ncbi:hypothetical protein JZ751_000629, partial [Albula glossodonta]
KSSCTVADRSFSLGMLAEILQSLAGVPGGRAVAGKLSNKLLLILVARVRDDTQNTILLLLREFAQSQSREFQGAVMHFLLKRGIRSQQQSLNYIPPPPSTSPQRKPMESMGRGYFFLIMDRDWRTMLSTASNYNKPHTFKLQHLQHHVSL